MAKRKRELVRVKVHVKDSAQRGWLFVTSALGKAVAKSTVDDDFCALCNAHPSSGHEYDCPLVVAAEDDGNEIKLIPEDDEGAEEE